MAKSFTKRMKDAFYAPFVRMVPRHVLVEEISRRQIAAFGKVHLGLQDGNSFSGEARESVSGESGKIMGEFVHALRSVSRAGGRLLLAGDRDAAKPVYGDVTGIPEDRIATAGMHEGMDFLWNYDQSPPAEIGQFDLIASHAIIEHLVNPYKHIEDCYGLLEPGGSLVVHTVMPGFKYHRYPVDCVRFFPDWFEEIAARLGASIEMRFVSTGAHIVYVFGKPDPAVT